LRLEQFDEIGYFFGVTLTIAVVVIPKEFLSFSSFSEENFTYFFSTFKILLFKATIYLDLLSANISSSTRGNIFLFSFSEGQNL